MNDLLKRYYRQVLKLDYDKATQEQKEFHLASPGYDAFQLNWKWAWLQNPLEHFRSNIN